MDALTPDVLADFIRALPGDLERGRTDAVDPDLIRWAAASLDLEITEVNPASLIRLRHRIADMVDEDDVFPDLKDGEKLARVWQLVMKDDRSWASLTHADGLDKTGKTWQRRFNDTIAPAVSGSLIKTLNAEPAPQPVPEPAPEAKRHRLPAVLTLAGFLAVVALTVGAYSLVSAGSTGFSSCEDVDDLAVSDCEALVDLLSLLPESGWTDSPDACSDRPQSGWPGVTCRGGRVSAIDLSDAGLSGEIPESIGQLSGLKRLNLRANSLTGPIPTTVSALINLESCDLSFNRLAPADASDPVAATLDDRCPGWTTSAFSGCDEAVGIDPLECEALVAMWNGLGGEQWRPNQWNDDPTRNWMETNTPCGGPDWGWSSVLCRNGRVEVLYFGDIGMSGQLPDAVGDLTALKELHAFDNGLVGPIPSGLAQLEQLQVCHLNGNSFDAVEDSALLGFLDQRCDRWTET